MSTLGRAGASALAAFTAAALLSGCASTPAGKAAPSAAPAPPAAQPAPAPEPAPSTLTVVGAGGDAHEAMYDLRFTQTVPPSSRFNFRDRELSFYFRPGPDVLYFQIENLQDRPVWIDWERSVFRDPLGRTGKVAHGATRWSERYGVQAPTQIAGLQSYSDYLIPMDFLLDPAGTPDQLHRPLIPVDGAAPSYTDREFGVDLVFLIEQQPRNYSFRFKVASVIPRPR